MKIYDLVPLIGDKTGSIESIIDKQYPHVAKKIYLMWGSTECLDFLEGLINFTPTPDRPHRQGFPFEVMTEIHLIIEQHQNDFPFMYSKMRGRETDVWGGGH